MPKARPCPLTLANGFTSAKAAMKCSSQRLATAVCSARMEQYRARQFKKMESQAVAKNREAGLVLCRHYVALERHPVRAVLDVEFAHAQHLDFVGKGLEGVTSGNGK